MAMSYIKNSPEYEFIFDDLGRVVSKIEIPDDKKKEEE